MNPSTNSPTIIAKDAIPCCQDSDLHFPALTCHIHPSKLTCLIGPHRTQLRTYLLMLSGISKPIEGQMMVLGRDISTFDQIAWRKFRYHVGYFSGSSPLLSAQHALMNVMLPVLYHLNLPFRETADKARALLTELDCQFEMTSYPAMLNGFQQAQLALARALIIDPALLILDLPFNNLGAKEREKMGDLLAKYNKDRTICMVGGLQYPHFLQQHAKQIIFISEHKIMIFNGWESFTKSKDQEIQALL